MGKYLLLFFIGLSLVKAQIYAPDTTFKFKNVHFTIPQYRFHTLIASNSAYTLAYIEEPIKEENGYNYSSIALLDTSGRILDTFLQVWVIPNSFTENGFWFRSYENTNYLDPRLRLEYYNLKTFKRTVHYFSVPEGTRGPLKIENDCLVMNGDIYYTFDLNGQLLSTINPIILNPNNTAFQNYAIQDIRVDQYKNTWVLVVKEFNPSDGSLQLYKLQPGENLDSKKIVFEKSGNALGNLAGSIWQQSNFNGDSILLKINKDFFKDRELITIDFKGNILPQRTILPLINNDPNTNYEFVDSFNTRYITLRVGEKKYYFIDSTGKLSSFDLSNTNILSLLIENDKVCYVDYLYELHEIEIKTLKLIDNKKKIPVINFDAGIRYVKSLNNNDFWVGYKNPYDINTNYFVKFHNGKEAYRFAKEVNKVFYAGGNDLILQAKDKEQLLINELNNETRLSKIEGEIVFIDTLNNHIYTNSPGEKVYRYTYNEIKDNTFKWEGGIIKSEMIVTEDKKIFYNGNRFNFNGEVDNTFKQVELLNYSGSPNSVYKLKRIWNTIYILDASCAEGCWGNVYQWEKSENHANLLTSNPNAYLYKYLNMAKRDSLFLDGFNKILPNLNIDNTFFVKGRVNGANYWNPSNSSLVKYLDILPNHDLLAIYKNQIYRFSTKNNLWVEIRNLPNELLLNDSLLKSGMLLDIFSSDNSEVVVHLKTSTEKVAHLEGTKLMFDGNEGILTLTAQSIKGGQPFEFTFWVRNPDLQLSNISISPRDTVLFTNFKPFSVIYSANVDVPLKITVEGTGGYLKDGMIHPTGVAGNIHVRVSHDFTSTHYANQREVLYQVNQVILSSEPENMSFPTSIVFPNPFKDYVNISGSDNDKIKDVYLCDLNGRRIMNLEVDKNANTPTGSTINKRIINFKTNHIQNGVYLLVFTINGKREVRRVVKL
jgi:hypothetical protein